MLTFSMTYYEPTRNAPGNRPIFDASKGSSRLSACFLQVEEDEPEPIF